MKPRISRTPPSGAPDGTVWFGGPVDRWTVALRVFGDDLDPAHISALLGVEPSSAARKGDPFPLKGRWILDIDSEDCDENDDVEDGVRLLLSRLPSHAGLWASLTTSYTVDVSCGLFLSTWNRGFGISADLSRLLADRNLTIGFDLYFDPPQTA